MSDEKSLDQQIAEGGARLEAELAEEAADRDSSDKDSKKGYPLNPPPGTDHWPFLGSGSYARSGSGSKGKK